MEWLDDVKQWKAGDANATERLREYVTPFVHGALLARMPHHLANALMAEALDTVLVSPEQVTKDSHFVTHAVAVARKLVKRTKPASLKPSQLGHHRRRGAGSGSSGCAPCPKRCASARCGDCVIQAPSWSRCSRSTRSS